MSTRKGQAPRVVLDTNVVLSALVFGGGPPADLRRAWQAGRCQPLMSKVTAAELIRVLAYPKFRLSAEDREQLLADYVPYCTSIPVPHRVPGIPTCRDPSDVPFLELAVAGRGNYLVTGDRDLLSLGSAVPIAIVTAADLPADLPAKGGSGHL